MKNQKSKASRMKSAIEKPSSNLIKVGNKIKTENDRTLELQGFSLGSAMTEYPTRYNRKILEAFENKNPNSMQWVSLICTEFTSLCPKTGQPDFAKIFINYVADKKMVESKSLKLYLYSFRNHGDFHEDCVQKICDDLVNLMLPKYIEVIGEFTPRGGIAIFPYSQYSNQQKEFQKLKEQRLATYRPGSFSVELAKLYS